MRSTLRISKLVVASLAIVLSSIPAVPGQAFVTFGIKAQFHTQTYLINANFTDIRSGTQAQQITAMQNGATDWNGQADYFYNYGGTTNINFVNNADGINAIYYAGAGSADGFQFGALAICFVSFDGNNFITGFDIEYYDVSSPTGNNFLYYGQGGHAAGHRRAVREIVDEVREAGRYAVSWNGADVDGRRVPSGIYVMRLATREGAVTRKMVVTQ